MKTTANVLVGVATLSIRQAVDAVAEWSTEQHQVGDYSAKLVKTSYGNDGSTHVQFNPPAGITLTDFDTTPADFGFYHYCSVVTTNWTQMELRFEDPDSPAWVEITAVPLQGHIGATTWVDEDLEDTTPCGYGGIDEFGESFSNWAAPLTQAGAVEAAIDLEAAVDSCGNWVLTRVRLELWEAAPARFCYIDTVTINAVVYAIEPDATTPAGLVLGSPFTEVGYTEDGVTLEYTVDEADIEVEEETIPIKRPITKETVAIICNMAESSLVNINHAIAGSLLSGSSLRLGGGVNKTLNVKIDGTDPDGHSSTIHMPLANATGGVAMPYKKGEKTIVPVTFQALKGPGPAVTIVYN